MTGEVIGTDGRRYIAHLKEPKEQASLIAQPGELAWYPKTAIPDGWVLADGAYYAPSTYPALFQAIGYAFGKSGMNFRVMEIIDFLRPYDQISNNLFTLVADEVRQHGHGGGWASSDGYHNHHLTYRDWLDLPVYQAYTWEGPSSYSHSANAIGTFVFSSSGSHSHYVSASGGGGPETVPRHTIMALCVCTVGNEIVYLGS